MPYSVEFGEKHVAMYDPDGNPIEHNRDDHRLQPFPIDVVSIMGLRLETYLLISPSFLYREPLYIGRGLPGKVSQDYQTMMTAISEALSDAISDTTIVAAILSAFSGETEPVILSFDIDDSRPWNSSCVNFVLNSADDTRG